MVGEGKKKPRSFQCNVETHKLLDMFQTKQYSFCFNLCNQLAKNNNNKF